MTAKLQPFLPAVVWLGVAASVVGSVVHWPRCGYAVLQVVVVFSMLIEILRVRRALS